MTSPPRRPNAAPSVTAGRTMAGCASPTWPMACSAPWAGCETSANDYARWVGFLLSGWPPRDGADTGPVKRATVREIVEGSNFATGAPRAPSAGPPCRVARAYGMGWRVLDDCDLGLGRHPQRRLPRLWLERAAAARQGRWHLRLHQPHLWRGQPAGAEGGAGAAGCSGALPARPVPVSARLAEGYGVAQAIWRAGSVTGETSHLAMNMLMDRDAAHWQAELKRLKAEVGPCPATEPITAATAMEGSFTWRLRAWPHRGPCADGADAGAAIAGAQLRCGGPLTRRRINSSTAAGRGAHCPRPGPSGVRRPRGAACARRPA